MDTKTQLVLSRAKDISKEYQRSWQAGFANQVIEALNNQDKQIQKLTRQLHNETELELIWCDCGKSHNK